nr:ribosomal protein S3 [Solanum glutinosum]UNZ89967.1 ribosomal protein S3 [Solanum glutinosum]
MGQKINPLGFGLGTTVYKKIKK